MKKKIAIVVIVLAIGGISAGFAWKGRGADRLNASGTLEARNISVGSKVGGRVTQVLVQEGDHVEPNQLLVIFDQAELKAQLQQARGGWSRRRPIWKSWNVDRAWKRLPKRRAAASTERAGAGAGPAQRKCPRGRRRKADQDYQRMDTLLARGSCPGNAGRCPGRAAMPRAQVRAMESAVDAATERLRAARASWH